MKPFLLLSVLCAAPLASAQTAVLNPPLPDMSEAPALVSDFLLHPSGTEVLFRGRSPEQRSLMRVPVDGSRAPVPVVSLPNGSSVTRYAFDAAGQWLAWIGASPAESRLFVHRVGTFGSTRRSRADQDAVGWFGIHGDRLLYLDGASSGHLFSVPLDGSSAPVELSPGLVRSYEIVLPASVGAPRVAFTCQLGTRVALCSARVDGSGAALELAQGSIFGLEVTSDGSTAVYREAVLGGVRLRSVRLDGSAAPVDLTGILGHVGNTRLSPDGQHFVYSANALEVTRNELFSVPIDGGPSLRISAPLTGTSQLFLLDVRGPRAYYATTISDAFPRLYSVPIEGGEPALLLAFHNSSATTLPSTLRFTADGLRVTYTVGAHAGFGAPPPRKLYSVPLDASQPQVLLEPEVEAFELSPDSSRVLFSRVSDDAVYVTAIDGSTAPTAIVSGSGNTSDFRFAFTPDGARVVVACGPLYGAHPSGAFLRQLSTATVLSSRWTVNDFVLDPTGRRVAFTERNRDDGRANLFSAPTDGSARAKRLALGEVSGMFITPDGQTVVFAQATSTGTLTEILRAPLDGSAAPTLVHAQPTGMSAFQLSPDGQTVLYTVRNLGNEELWSLPLAGGTPVRLELVDELFATQFARLSQTVFYIGEVAGQLRLHRAALDGSGVVELAAGSLYPSFQLSPDEISVVLWTTTQLEVVSADGSSASVPLGPAPFSEVAPVITPDNDEVVYIADGELLVARLDRATPLRVLAQAESFQLAHGGTQVLFTHAPTPFEPRLFAAPLDGSQAPVELGPVRTFSSFAPTPDGLSVVFLDEQLWLARADGSQPAVTLTQHDGPTSQIGDFFLTPDSTRVVYVHDIGGGQTQLWGVPFDGSTRPLRLDSAATAPALGSKRPVVDGQHLFYLGRRNPSFEELFSTRLPDQPQDRHLGRR